MEKERLVSLVTAAQGGDPAALNDLFNGFYNDVYYFALKTVKDDQIACDVTQETFVEIINTLGDLQEPAAFVKWMKQITYHQCTRYFKKKKDVIVDEDEEGNTVFDTLQEEKADFIPDEALDKAEFKQTIMAMIDDLSEEQRAAVMLFYFDELSIKQIAEIQGTNENTVKSRLNYAKKNIKKSVEDYEKKSGIKLHSVGILPIILWLFKGYFAQSAPASAAVVAKAVATATGTAVSASGIAATTTATAATATTATTVGLGAKLAALPLVTKIVAGVAAAAIVAGGGTAAVVLSGGEEKPDSAIVETTTEAVDPTEPSTKPAPTLEQRLSGLPERLYSIGSFTSVEELTAQQVFDWAIREVQPVAEERDMENLIFSYTYAIEDVDSRTKSYFGKTWDYSGLNDGKRYQYTPETVKVTYYGASGDAGPEITYQFYEQMGENTYLVAYAVGYPGQEAMDLWFLKVMQQNDSFVMVSQFCQEAGEGEEVFRYYDLARITDQDFSKEYIVAKTLAVAENVAGHSGDWDSGEDLQAIYAADAEAAAHSELDIFGYGLSMEEIVLNNWGSVYIDALLVGENMDVQFRSIQISTHIPIQDPTALPEMIRRDIGVFERFIGDGVDPYLFENHQGTIARDLDTAIGKIVKGEDPNTHLSLYTLRTPVVDGANYEMSANISVTQTEGVWYYNVGFHMAVR